MSRKSASRLGVLMGGMTSAAGVWLGIDMAAGLMAGGGVLAAWCLFLTDVDPPEGGKEGRR
ncbi:hypothetical protein [Streptomyces sp. NPDC002402]